MFIRTVLMAVFSLLISGGSILANDKLVIASHSTSSPAAGNSLAGLVYAATTGADLAEHALVLTKDNQLVAHTSLHLDSSTTISTLFPDRSREDGKYYVIDFTLSEIRQLTVVEPQLDSTPHFHIPSLRDILLLHAELEKSLGKAPGLYLEIKHPWFHLKEGKDISKEAVSLLKTTGYAARRELPVYLACFDPEELQRIHKTLLPSEEANLRLVQLFDEKGGLETQRQGNKGWESYDYGWLFTRLGLKVVSSYADALGLATSALLSSEGQPLLGEYTLAAQALGLQIHARADVDQQFTRQYLEQLFFTVGAETLSTSNWNQVTKLLPNTDKEVAPSISEKMTEAEDFPLNPVNPLPRTPVDTGETATQF